MALLVLLILLCARSAQENSPVLPFRVSPASWLLCCRCRYAWAAISEWQCQQGVTQQGMLGSEVVLSGPTALRRSHSMSCMTQLQAKHSGTPFDQLDGAAG